MRKPRDYDAELKALDDKAKLLKTRKLQQLGELVIACGADALPVERLAGALLLAVDEQSQSAKEAQRARGSELRLTPVGRSYSTSETHSYQSLLSVRQIACGTPL